MTDQQIIELVELETRNLAQAVIYAAQLVRDAVHDSNSKRKSIAEMLGEFLRDAGVLILVFVPVDILWPIFSKTATVDPKLIKWTLGLSVGSLVAGILIEQWRDL